MILQYQFQFCRNSEGKIILARILLTAPQATQRTGPGETVSQSLQQITTFTGTVNEWINNDDYVYDGFYLQTTLKSACAALPGNN
jgi:hypothetical protein